MKIAIAQLNFHIGNFSGNTDKMIRAIEDARRQGADLVCFSELATCGYPPRDFLEFDDFIRQSEESIDRLSKAATGIGVVVGAPNRNQDPEGKDLFNAAFLLEEGAIRHISNKALLPTYDIFDEYRYFEPSRHFSTCFFRERQLAFTVCEDIWNIGNENPLYTICPLDELIKSGPEFVLNVSASPFSQGQARERKKVLLANVERYKVPFFYVNHCGAQTELLFDGGSMVVSPDGQIYDELPYFREAVRTYDLDDVIRGGKNGEQEWDRMELIHEALVTGIRDYFGKLGLQKAIIGLSGGIDSAVVAVLAVDALGPENVRVLLMPSPFSSDHSVKDARQLAMNLGIQYDLIPIEGIYQSCLDVLKPHFWATDFNVAEENLQARSRALLLMAMSNKYGAILLNTSNKSEMAVGYGTLYGDMCGGLSVIGDLYKTEVFQLARFMNQHEELIPENIINKPPSAELRPGQFDSDTLPPYDVLDEILKLYIEKRQGPLNIMEQGYDEALVHRVLRMVNLNEFKRFQAAPVLRVSTKAFGMGRRMPIVAKYLTGRKRN